MSNKQDLNSLRSQVANSPDNIALRLTLALKLFKVKEFDESEKNFQAVLKLDSDNIKAKQGLIELYFAKENFSAVIIIAEELASRNIVSEKIMELHVKSLLKQNSHKEAQELYNKMLDRNPFYFDEELDSVLADDEEYNFENDAEADFEDGDFEGMPSVANMQFPDFISNPSLLYLPSEGNSVSSLIGMSDLINLGYVTYENRELTPEDKEKYNISNFQFNLLYGPPGCGKTYFISTIPEEHEEDVFPFDWGKVSGSGTPRRDLYIPFHFNMAKLEYPVTLYFDKLEDVVGKNNPDVSLMAGQFIGEMDTVITYNQDFTMFACSSRPWLIDNAIINSNRFNNTIFVAPPNKEDRLEYLKKIFSHVKFKNNIWDQLVDATSLMSFLDMKSIANKIFALGPPIYMLKADPYPPLSTERILEFVQKTTASPKTWYEQMKQEADNNFKVTYLYQEIEDFFNSASDY